MGRLLLALVIGAATAGFGIYLVLTASVDPEGARGRFGWSVIVGAGVVIAAAALDQLRRRSR
jgi:hypothetical protein